MIKNGTATFVVYPYQETLRFDFVSPRVSFPHARLRGLRTGSLPARERKQYEYLEGSIIPKNALAVGSKLTDKEMAMKQPAIFVPHGGGPAFFMRGSMHDSFEPMAGLFTDIPSITYRNGRVRFWSLPPIGRRHRLRSMAGLPPHCSMTITVFRPRPTKLTILPRVRPNGAAGRGTVKGCGD